MDELGFYVPSTVFQSFRDDGSRREMVIHTIWGFNEEKILNSLKIILFSFLIDHRL